MSKTSLAGALAVVALGLSGCMTTVRLPLCPKLAEASYETAAAGHNQIVGAYVKCAAQARHITITPLSPFIAEFRGTRGDIAWLTRNYPALLCAFDTRQVLNDEATYRSVSGNVAYWMAVVSQRHDDRLMDDRFKYCPNCCAEQ